MRLFHDLDCSTRYAELHARCHPAVIEIIDADHAAFYRRSAAVAARHRNFETAAFCARPETLLTGSAEPPSAEAWGAISSAYRHLCSARLTADPRLRALYLAAAARDRSRAKCLRAADAGRHRLRTT